MSVERPAIELEPKINGEPWKVVHGHMAYIVVLKDGPADGLKTVACHTRAVYFGGHRYALNDQGDFVYAPMRESVPSITCPRCGRTTYNPNDIRERYCGHCHAWHEGMQ